MTDRLILGIETSGLLCSIAFQKKEQLLFEASIEKANVHGAVLAELVNDGLKRIGISSPDITAIACSSGPGSFTGLRIGMSYAKGLAFGLDIPLVTVSNYEILKSCAPAGSEKIISVIDARRGRFYVHTFKDELQESFNTGTTNWDGLMPMIDERSVVVADHYVQPVPQEVYERCRVVISGIRMRAGLLCDLAGEKIESGEFLPVDESEPLYLQPFAGVL